MTVYKREKTNLMKWVLAIIVFVMAMTITFSDVYGLGVPSGASGLVLMPGNPGEGYQVHRLWQTPETYAYHEMALVPPREAENNDDPAGTVPEPTTLVLLSCGLVGTYMSLRNKK